MPKLLQINIALTGSTGKIARQIGELAIDNGWESWIAYSGYGEEVQCKSNLFRIGGKLNFLEHALETRLFDNHGLASRCATKKLIRQIKEIKPDIIHLHNIHGYYLNYGILFKYLASLDTPVVWTLHDCWTMTGHCAHFVTAGCDKWKTGCFDCPLKKGYPASWCIDRSRRNWEEKKGCFTSVKKMTVVPVSHWLEGIVKESYLSKYPIKVIQNGIDLNVFHPQDDSAKDSGRFTILGVANVWNNGKGLAEFIELSKNPEYQVILVGGKEEQMKDLPKEIKHIERTTNQLELAKLYAEADVLVNPTYADTFPTVNIEALACGTPVVTYETGGSPEILDENTGIVVHCGDVKALEAAVEKLRQESDEERKARRKACAARAESLFDKTERFEEYIRLYDSLLNK